MTMAFSSEVPWVDGTPLPVNPNQMIRPELAIQFRALYVRFLTRPPKYLADTISRVRFPETWEMTESLVQRYARDIASGISVSQVVIWKEVIWNAATRDAVKAFPKCRLDFHDASIGLIENQLWCFQGSFAPGLCEPGKLLTGIYFHSNENSISAALFFLAVPGDEKQKLSMRVLETINDGDEMTELWASILAARYFLELKLTSMEPSPPHNKAQLRKLKKQFGDLPDIRIVTLRKREQGAGHDDRGVVDWKHHWIVSGHWRRQWIASMQSHAPRYIQPYVKGPQDKPMMPVRETIFKASR